MHGLSMEVVRRSVSSTPPPPPKKKNHNLEVKAFIRQFRCVIGEMRHWKTPPDHHLNCAIHSQFIAQFNHLNCAIKQTWNLNSNYANLRKFVIRNSNDHSNCALCSRVKTRLVNSLWMCTCSSLISRNVFISICALPPNLILKVTIIYNLMLKKLVPFITGKYL